MYRPLHQPVREFLAGYAQLAVLCDKVRAGSMVAWLQAGTLHAQGLGQVSKGHAKQEEVEGQWLGSRSPCGSRTHI